MRAILNISLPQVMVADIKDEVSSGQYATVSEFFRQLIRNWKEEKLLRELKQSQKEFKRGKYIELKSLKDLR